MLLRSEHIVFSDCFRKIDWISEQTVLTNFSLRAVLTKGLSNERVLVLVLLVLSSLNIQHWDELDVGGWGFSGVSTSSSTEFNFFSRSNVFISIVLDSLLFAVVECEIRE